MSSKEENQGCTAKSVRCDVRLVEKNGVGSRGQEIKIIRKRSR